MTGATEFTRKSGAIGLWTLPFTVLAFFLLASAYTNDTSPGWGVLVLLVALAGGLVFAIGLLYRHRHFWWAGPVAKAGAFALPVLLLGVITQALPLIAFAFLVLELAFAALMIGMLVAGALNRAPIVLLLMGSMLDGSHLHAVVGSLLGLVGYVWLAGELWREPLSSDEREEAPGGYGRAPYGADLLTGRFT